jgi:alpha-L-fucosidase 2
LRSRLFPAAETYFQFLRTRNLDLDNRAVATVRYRDGDATFTREVFSSYPDQVMVVRLTCDEPGK